MKYLIKGTQRFLNGSGVKKLMQFQSLGGEDPLKAEMATHSSTFARKIPWTEEPSGLQSVGSQKVGHN